MFIKAIFTYLTVVIIGSVTAWIERKYCKKLVNHNLDQIKNKKLY